jgi:ribonucleoside-diphosphate reductase alpha chain
MAWKMGLKSLYYLRSDKVRKADKVGAQVKRQRIEETIDMTAIVNGETCLACEG